MSSNDSMTDIFGNTIEAGDTIVYPARKGSDMWLNQAVVERIVRWNDREPVVAWEPGLQRYVVTGHRNVAKFVIEAERIGTVVGGTMSMVEQPRKVRLTRRDHLMLAAV